MKKLLLFTIGFSIEINSMEQRQPFPYEQLPIELQKEVLKQVVTTTTPLRAVRNLHNFRHTNKNFYDKINKDKSFFYDIVNELVKNFPGHEVGIARAFHRDIAKEWLKKTNPNVIYETNHMMYPLGITPCELQKSVAENDINKIKELLQQGYPTSIYYGRHLVGLDTFAAGRGLSLAALELSAKYDLYVYMDCSIKTLLEEAQSTTQALQDDSARQKNKAIIEHLQNLQKIYNT
ncbi:hypothetical protein Noda2021_09280 [Candidatus Dependentiae bacterium Noda2021]|nr:hypothetical protein Noda2021_09280 [Candidatus Dependentiae bacterium Noda2021]